MEVREGEWSGGSEKRRVVWWEWVACEVEGWVAIGRRWDGVMAWPVESGGVKREMIWEGEQ